MSKRLDWKKGVALLATLGVAAGGLFVAAPATANQPCNYWVIQDCKANNGFPYRSVQECIDVESVYVCGGGGGSQPPFVRPEW